MFLSWWEVRKNEILCFWVGGKLRKTEYYVSELVGSQEKRNIMFLSWWEVRKNEILCFWVGGKLRKTKYYVSELGGS